jgi:hypothetical protein
MQVKALFLMVLCFVFSGCQEPLPVKKSVPVSQYSEPPHCDAIPTVAGATTQSKVPLNQASTACRLE